MKKMLSRAAVAVTVGLGLTATAGTFAGAVPYDNQPFEFDIDAGLVCSFPLRIQSDAAGRLQRFYDAQGREVRVVGRGPNLTFTNLDTGAVYRTYSNGTVLRYEYAADGSYKVSSGGHTITLLTPGDSPGPGATLIVGNQRIAVDPNSVWTVVRTSGRTTDICAALS